jgi:putative ABC transport system permease protein
MIKNYLKITFRNLVKNKVFSLINIIGLATGICITLLISLWVWDEISFNHYYQNHGRLGEIVSVEKINGTVTSWEFSSVPIAAALRNRYPEDFKRVSVTREINAVLALGDKKINASGLWAEPAFPAMLTLKMKKGGYNTFSDPSSVLISETLARSLFADKDPVNQQISINNEFAMKISGVYEDLPHNTQFADVTYMLAWDNKNNLGNKNGDDWLDHHFQVFVQLNEKSDFVKTSAKIKNLTKPHIAGSWEELMLHPMDRWHLYTNFNQPGAEGRIRFVRLFGIIAVFVLMIACINFMNLSTARSEKRAKEVGIRKTMGSLRYELILQFLGESLIMVLIALFIALIAAQLFIPYFNRLSGKQLSIPFLQLSFWLWILVFTLFTGILAGSYPAFFLSRFKAIKVLKGNYKSGRYASLPRKVLVVVQFTVCISVIIGTITVYRQIQFGKSRPMGYAMQNLITTEMNTASIKGHYDALRNDLMKTGVVEDMAESSSSTTGVRNAMMNYDWKGRDPRNTAIVGTVFVTYDFGRTIDWKILDGRDFSRNYSTDSFAFILNEAAVTFTGLKHPVGKVIHWHDQDHPIVGVVKDMVMESPYTSVEPTFFVLLDRKISVVTMRLKHAIPAPYAIGQIENVFKKYDPESPFEYHFTTETYNWKFAEENNIGNISGTFCLFAIFISCLGLFGLSSFMAEQRSKEIAVRKVLGARIFNLWRLLSSEFVLLVLISCFIATPIAWYTIHQWLEQYEFRTPVYWWLFVLVGMGTMVIALLTISFQIIKAALLNPVQPLRSE